MMKRTRPGPYIAIHIEVEEVTKTRFADEIPITAYTLYYGASNITKPWLFFVSYQRSACSRVLKD